MSPRRLEEEREREREKGKRGWGKRTSQPSFEGPDGGIDETIDVPRLEKVAGRAEQAEKDKERGRCYVAPSEECVLAPDPRDRRDDDRLGARELADGVVLREKRTRESDAVNEEEREDRRHQLM